MADPSPSSMADSSSSSPPEPVDLLGRPPIKRARPQLSCTPCRQGKLKCNREHPVCDQCTKRSREDACQYVPPPARNKQAQNMRGRIRNLESLVVNLINQKTQEQGNTQGNRSKPSSKDPTESGNEANVESFGQLSLNQGGQDQTYVGAGHWSAVLKEVEEIKDSLENGDQFAEPEDDEASDEVWSNLHKNTRSTITYGMPKPMTKSMLIQAMPPKTEVDRLLPLWFNSADPLLYIIHAPTFQSEYKQFWKDPSSMPVMWIALLYSAMALGLILGPRNPGLRAHAEAWERATASVQDVNDRMTMAADKYQQLASSAMVLADIAKPQPYTLETLMVYAECEFLRRDDHHSKIFLMIGTSIRVAMRMGYHRDPSHFNSVTPFQGEMRRRIWHVINMMDALVSFAIGLPGMVRRIESDVQPPRNLYDSDFSVDCTELPKGRPPSELTPATYTIAKSRLCSVFAEAAELSQKVVAPAYSSITALEKSLEEAHDLIPEGMRVRPMEDSITDAPVLIMGRYNIELLYLKTKIVLHRNYLTAGQTDPKFAESRKICVEASMEALAHQRVIYHACEPGGQLHKVWWYMSSLSTYDFLLAAMVICLELNHLRTTESKSSPKETSIQNISQMMTLLENTYEIWANHPNRFRESVRGAEIVRAMLKKCSEPSNSSSILQDSVPSGFEKNTAQPLTEPSPPSMSDELPSQAWGSVWPSDNTQSFGLPNISSEIDWNLWDSTMQGQTNMLPQMNWSFQDLNMDAWNSMTNNVDLMLSSMPLPDTRAEAGIVGPSFFTPVPEFGDMDYSTTQSSDSI